MPASIKHLSQIKDLGPAVATILAKWNDDMRYYLVTVLDCDEKTKKCKVRFEDGLETTMSNQDLHLELALSHLTDDLIVCSICDDGDSKPPNEIVVCDLCHQGYHMQCHKPPVDKTIFDDEKNEWICKVCDELESSSKKHEPKSRPLKEKTTNLEDKKGHKEVKGTKRVKLTKPTDEPIEESKETINEENKVIETKEFTDLVASDDSTIKDSLVTKERPKPSSRVNKTKLMGASKRKQTNVVN